MKTPRVTDFDPKETPQLGSPMDDLPAIQPPVANSLAPSPSSSPQLIDNRPIEQPLSTPVRPFVAPPVRTPVRRTLTRYSFEFFQDQIESLRRFSLEEKARGEKGSMSQMV